MQPRVQRGSSPLIFRRLPVVAHALHAIKAVNRGVVDNPIAIFVDAVADFYRSRMNVWIRIIAVTTYERHVQADWIAADNKVIAIAKSVTVQIDVPVQ